MVIETEGLKVYQGQCDLQGRLLLEKGESHLRLFYLPLVLDFLFDTDAVFSVTLLDICYWGKSRGCGKSDALLEQLSNAVIN